MESGDGALYGDGDMGKRNSEVLRQGGEGQWAIGFLCLESLEGLESQI